jgi:hypothetical protein
MSANERNRLKILPCGAKAAHHARQAAKELGISAHRDGREPTATGPLSAGAGTAAGGYRQGEAISRYAQWKASSRVADADWTGIARTGKRVNRSLLAAGPERIERFFGTAQDQLVKGSRKAGARTLEQADAYLVGTNLLVLCASWIYMS